jgi:hypothetical protein
METEVQAPSTLIEELTYTVTGTVASPVSAGVGGLTVDIVDKNVGPDVTLATTTTNPGGNYSLVFRVSLASLKQRLKTSADLQASVSYNKTVLAVSAVSYNATPYVTLDVVLPASVSVLPSEYETLTNTLSSVFAGKLSTLEQNEQRQDITYLANKTGWDARAVAMAALADQFSTQAAQQQALHPAFYYALFRSGLPSNTATLYRTDAATVTSILTNAIAAEIIPAALKGQVADAVKVFSGLSASSLLNTAAIANTSTVGSLLNPALGDDPKAKQNFANVYVQNQTNPDEFWQGVSKQFGAATGARLQLDGQLSYLTLNNAQLLSNLHAAEAATPLTAPLDLVRRGYYLAPKWNKVMEGVSVELLPGATLDEKRSNFVALMIAQLRLSYPTAVLSEMVNDGSIPLSNDANIQKGVYQFLAANQGAYEVGVQPLDQYLAQSGLDKTTDSKVVAQIKRLQRVYQVTPSDTAMIALLKNGLDSAYAITHYGQDSFVRSFSDAMGGADAATLVFNKARAVYNAVLNVTTDYMSRRVAPTLGNGTTVYVGPFRNNVPPATSNPAASATLETLFGSMDYCACDECRSILGPAAYLVDLLNHINIPSPAAGYANPQAVLLARRPDLAYLPLSCDNTNTSMPYIDLVNETLEYFAAHGSMAGYQGFSTDTTVTTSAELIATPQNVNTAAYNTLKAAIFPPPLPFDRSLSMLRLLFQQFDVNLPDAMATLRANDLIQRASAGAYGWLDILMEELGLSRQEFQILTDSTDLTLEQIYGLAAAMTDAQAVTALSSVQYFATLLNVAYIDLASILQTHFINPNGTLVPQLETLTVSFSTIAALKAGTISPAAFLALLPAGPGAPDPANFGGDIVAWLTDPARYAQIMSIITFSNSSGDLCSVKGLQFSYANPDTTKNQLQPIDFYRLLRFIRLWQKLGFTIQQTDDLITALSPTNASAATLAQLDAQFLALLPRAGFVYRAGVLLGVDLSTNLDSLLTCWAPIGIYGDSNSQYDAMFLNPPISAQDPAFARDEDANVLQDATQAIMSSATEQKAIVAGTVTAGDLLTTTINGIPIDYSVVAADASATALALKVVASVNATTTLDPLTGSALNTVVQASSVGAVITFLSIGAGGAFTLAAAASPGASETFSVIDHSAALRAAFHLTASEFTLITQALAFDSTTVLNLANISAIYRNGWLARQLEISVAELLLMIQFTGLNPFAPPDPSPAPPAEPPMILLVRLVQAMTAASLAPVQALYLLWNQDISGTSAPAQADINAIAYTLRSDFAAVDAQFTLTDDPTGAIANSLMTLVYGSVATNFFFGLLNNTVTVAVPYESPVPAAVITASTGRLTYDDFAKQLIYAGILDAPTLTALQTAAGADPGLQTALLALNTANLAAVGPFLAQYPELLAAYQKYVASNDTLQNKRNALLAMLLPPLEAARKVEQALTAVSSAAGFDPSFAQALLQDKTVMQAADPGQPAVTDLTAVEGEGLSAQFFLTDNPALPPDQTVNHALPQYAAGSTNTLPAGSGGSLISGIWSGYLDCPQSGYYLFAITADAGAAVTLTVAGAAVTITQNANVWANASPISLTAGQLTSIVLTVSHLSSTLSLSWQGQAPGTGIAVIPGQYLYSQIFVTNIATVYTRYLKAVSLATGLGLVASELVFLVTDADTQIAGANWLNVLPTVGTLAGPAAAAFYPVLLAFLTFAHIKTALSPNDQRVLQILQNPALTLANKSSALQTLTKWDTQSLNALLARFSGSASLRWLQHLANFARLYDAFTVVNTCGISASALLSATTNAPTANTIVDFEAAVRARYAESDWLTVTKPINDTMRQQQRDALVAYVLRLSAGLGLVVDINTPVTTADTLYEYLLMDVQMQPCMLTSRIRLALSSVQLFIERSIRGLELDTTDTTKNVNPSIVPSSTWTWMKRYRVWEANREVFLWPENWLYPELRDDATPFFTTIMSKLLQSDITEDAASDAYLQYLSALTNVAKLEPCATYCVPPASAGMNPCVHLVAQTPGATRSYLYRYFDGAVWQAWQPIPVTIEDTPLLLYVWNNRLLLFWLQIVADIDNSSQANTTGDPSKADETITDKDTKIGDFLSAMGQPDPGAMKVTVKVNLFWSEYYNGQWQAARSSDTKHSPVLCQTPATGPNAFDRSQIQLSAYPECDPTLSAGCSPMKNRLWVVLQGPGICKFCLYNTHTTPVPNPAGFPYLTLMSPDPYQREVYLEPPPSTPGSTTLTTYYLYNDLKTTPSSFKVELISTNDTSVLTNTVDPQSPMRPDPLAIDWTAPFFFEDSSNVFCVQTSMAKVPLHQYPVFGLVPHLQPTSIGSASLVLRGKGATLDHPPIDPGDPTGFVGVSNPAPITRYVSEDAYIERGLPTTGSVKFGSVQIGVSGTVSNQMAGDTLAGDE